MKVPAIILAAGESKRLGAPKAELSIGKKTLLDDQIDRLLKGGCHNIVVVAGAYPVSRLSAGVPGKNVSFVANKQWRLGQFSSIKCGLRALKTLSGGCLILPVDVPFVPSGLIKKILSGAAKDRFDAVIPVLRSRGTRAEGHPIWLARHLINKVIKSNTKTGRLDRILQLAGNVLFLETRSTSILNNINTIKDWKKLSPDNTFNII